LYYPYGAAVDAAGNLYIADLYNERVRKVATNGIITTVAGNGSASYSGDGGAATSAGLDWPLGIAVDAFGNLYIADEFNERIRKVGTNGIISTVAGNGTPRFSGDGGAATNASLLSPSSVALDASGNLYIDDYGHERIRKVDTNGLITTVAGNGGQGYSGDGGAATNASLDYPNGVAVDAFGNLYIDDFSNQRIRKVDTNGIITTVAGNGNYGYTGDGGAATNASLWAPRGVAVDSLGNLYIADMENNRIRKVDTNGIITTMAGNGSPTYAGDSGAATSASLYVPGGVAVDASGNLYIADTGNQRIREVAVAGYPTFTITNAGAVNAGNYTVVIMNPYGSVTSAVAALAVTIPNTPPQIVTSDLCFGFVTNQFGFHLSGAFGQTIVVDGSADLVNWTPLCTNTVGAGAVYFCDPGWTNFGWRFYRARLQ
jgi:sugar lactone lactonase YvrE